MEYLRRFRWGITAVLVLLAVLGCFLLWKPNPPAAAPAAVILVYTPTALPTATSLPSVTPASVMVYVSGAVVRPGVYALPAGARVTDALAAAGGATPQADLVQINLARRVHDEEQIHIPQPGEPTRPAAAPVAGPAGGPAGGKTGKININTATQAELDSLPGVGPGYAQRIIAYRESQGPFRSIEEIQNVPGIGPALFARIRELITVE